MQFKIWQGRTKHIDIDGRNINGLLKTKKHKVVNTPRKQEECHEP